MVTWGAMVLRCEQAADRIGGDIEVIDLRTLMPWDKDAVMESVKRTHRCMVVHEDNITAGFGAEITALIADEAFFELDAPPRRVAMPDVPSPHSPLLLEAVLPGVDEIASTMSELIEI